MFRILNFGTSDILFCHLLEPNPEKLSVNPLKKVYMILKKAGSFFKSLALCLLCYIGKSKNSGRQIQLCIVMAKIIKPLSFNQLVLNPYVVCYQF